MIVKNKTRFINFISGINGVASGGQATLNLPVNQRYHRIILQCTSGAGVADAVTDVIDTIKILVNGVSVRDISPANMIRLAVANGYIPKLGELPILFTEPFGANVNEPPDITSWDMAGQASFTIQIGLKAVTTPGITGIYEFDFLRNLRPDAKGGLTIPYLQSVSQHQQSQPLVEGRNDITTIPFDFPIRRLWFAGSTPGDISQIELYQDGNKILEATTPQLVAAYRQYGFKFSQVDFMPFVNATGPADLGVSALVETPVYFDAAFLADVDSRWWKAMSAGQSLNVRVTSDSAQTLTTVIETIPGSFAG